jgi:hypothetical protein
MVAVAANEVAKKERQEKNMRSSEAQLDGARIARKGQLGDQSAMNSERVQ